VRKYLVPGFFFALGLVMQIRIAWLRSHQVSDLSLIRILAAFALSVGAFLLALAIMTAK
jgi:hypothetical protein